MSRHKPRTEAYSGHAAARHTGTSLRGVQVKDGAGRRALESLSVPTQTPASVHVRSVRGAPEATPPVHSWLRHARLTEAPARRSASLCLDFLTVKWELRWYGGVHGIPATQEAWAGGSQAQELRPGWATQQGISKGQGNGRWTALPRWEVLRVSAQARTTGKATGAAATAVTSAVWVT